MRILLAALTGMGNAVLPHLASSPLVDALMVVTRSEAGPFPYFPCPPLTKACQEAGMDCRVDADLDNPAGLELVHSFAPDLLLTATYHRIVPQAVINCARFAVNIHPSLLPRYAGPTPTNWAVACGESESGVSFHMLEAKIDSGPLLMQYYAPIAGMTDGQVRQTLYALAGCHVLNLLEVLGTGAVTPLPRTGVRSAYPRFTSARGVRLMQLGGFSRDNLVRAATPYPGTQFLVSNGL